jgi:anti-sigma factor RsiW
MSNQAMPGDMNDADSVNSRREVDRYLAGQLSPEESSAFEERLLESPQLQDEVALLRRMKLGLKTLREKGELDALLAQRPAWLPNRWLAVAASVLIVAGLAYYLAPRSVVAPVTLAASLDAFGPELRSRPVAELLLARTRGGGAAIAIAADGRIARIQVEAGAAYASQECRVLLFERMTNGSRRQVDGRAIKADEFGVLVVYVDPRALGPGKWMLAVNADGPAAAQETYEFEITPGP